MKHASRHEDRGPLAATLLCGAEVFAPECKGVCDLLIIQETIALMAKDIPDKGWLPCRRYNLHGKKLIPGLVDGHVHLIGGGGEGGPTTRTPEVSFDELVQSGVTTAVGVLGFDTVTRHMTSLLAKSRALQELGMSTYLYTGGYQLPPSTITGDIQHDLVLVDKILGVGEVAISDHRSSQPQARELASLAAKARIGGILSRKPGIVHLHCGDGSTRLEPLRQVLAETGLPAGQFFPTHVNRTSALLKEAGSFALQGGNVDLTATASPEYGEMEAVPPEDAFIRMIRAGIPAERITLSSDANGSLPVFDAQGRLVELQTGHPRVLWDTVLKFLAKGVLLEDVLPLVTSNPARILGLSGKGRISAGYDADLIVLDAANRLERVMARGVFYGREDF